MKTNELFPVVVVTVYLIIYCILLQIESTTGYGVMMFAFSPVMIVWMVYSVIRYGKYNGPELGEKEFGYQDRSDNDK